VIWGELFLEVTCRILGGWAIVAGGGWLADAPRWANGGPLGRDLHRWQRSRWSRWHSFDSLHSSHGLALLGLLQTMLGLWLLLMPRQPLIPLLALGLTGALQALRGAGDGADKMAMVVTVGCSLQAIGSALDQPVLSFAGVLWIGGQLTLAYATSGYSKLRHAVWRDGTAIRGALSSYAYGCSWAARLVRTDGSAKLLAWAVILPEILFPFALLLPPEWLAGVLGLFLFLHLSIAAAMGLNTYPLAFASAYPSTVILGQWLRIRLGIG
jgi:hypothetical protein